MATAPVKPLIGGASAPPEGHELNLVSFDKPGYPQLLLQELGDLPLYLDNDGFSLLMVCWALQSFLLAQHSHL